MEIIYQVLRVLNMLERERLTYAALNGLDVLASDILNAFLSSPSFQKHFLTESWDLRMFIRRP
jgi:hypothetical protein